MSSSRSYSSISSYVRLYIDVLLLERATLLLVCTELLTRKTSVDLVIIMSFWPLAGLLALDFWRALLEPEPMPDLVKIELAICFAGEPLVA